MKSLHQGTDTGDEELMNVRGINEIQSEGQRKAKMTPRIAEQFWIGRWYLLAQGCKRSKYRLAKEFILLAH